MLPLGVAEAMALGSGRPMPTYVASECREGNHTAGRDLYWAAKNGDEDALNSALSKGASIAWGNDTNHGVTPLHAASARGHCNCISRLLEAGASVNALCHKLKSAIARAAEEGHQEAVQLLLSAGADPDLGEGALGLAIARRDNVQRTLEMKRKINSPAVDKYAAQVESSSQIVAMLSSRLEPSTQRTERTRRRVVEGVASGMGGGPNAGTGGNAALAVGTVVRLHSLNGRPELNGRCGVVAAPLDPTTGRVGVDVDGAQKTLALKPSNLNLARSTGLAALAANFSDDPVMHDALAGITARFDPEDTSDEALIHAVARVWKDDHCSKSKHVYSTLKEEGQWRGKVSLADVEQACKKARTRGLISEPAGVAPVPMPDADHTMKVKVAAVYYY